MRNFKLIARLTAVFTAAMIVAVSGWGAASYVSGATAAQLAAQIQGPGITITNPQLKRGKASQAGTFSNGIAGAKLEVDEGIILTGMSVNESFTTNSSWRTSLDNSGSSTDADLLAIDAKARYDTVVFEFDVTLGANTRLLMVDYQFASEEYNEYVGSQFNDAFGFFVSGGDLTKTYNIARVVDDSTIVTTANIENYVPVTVNNVNNGSVGIYDDTTPQILTNSQYFINNCVKGTGVPNCTQSQAPVDVEYDGLTHRLHATLDNLTPGVTYHFKMALADTGDSQWDTGVFVNKIMGIRGPQLCYDYAYKQNNQFITNKTYIGQTPQIDSTVFPNTVVPVSIYIKNVETSELTAQNLKMSINDINISQAVYSPNSVSLIAPNQMTATSIPDSTNGMSVADNYIHDIPIGQLKSNEYFYLGYSLMPSVNTLKMPLNASLSFDLSVQGVTIPYSYTLGSNKVPMCASTVSYQPTPGIFNMVDKQLNTGTLTAGSTNVKYNLPTQIANRPTEMKLVSFDPISTNIVKATNTVVAVEMIDAGGYFETNASCSDPRSAITPRAWVKIGNFDANTTNVNFDKSLLGTGMNIGVTESQFYNQVRENVAYRMSYNLDDNNGSVQVETLANGKSKLKYFTTYAGEKCMVDIDGNPNSNDTVPQWCGSNGGGQGTGMSPAELQVCMECIYGMKTRVVCSRDNFAVRPEAFNVQMKDPTGLGAIPSDANISAGYMYSFDANATNHIDSTPTPGYVASFSSTQSSADRNVTLAWEPNGHVVTGCNDITSPFLEFYFVDGKITNQTRNHNNVGRYVLQARDKKWAAVDQAPMNHHVGNTNWISGNDCAVGGEVPLYDAVNNTYNLNMVGCEISSNHLNHNTGVKYNDSNLTFHPYQFGMSGSFRIGEGNSSSVPPNIALNTGDIKFVYMADINNSNEMNMSVRGDYQITAQGATNGALSNFVRNCYAKDMNITLNRVHSINQNLSNYQARFSDKNVSTGVVLQEHNTTVVPFGNKWLRTADDSNFTKDGAGTLKTEVRLNYDRNSFVVVNPITVTFGDFGVSCANPAECQHRADGLTSHEPTGNTVTNFSVAHYYGRAQGQYTRIRSPRAQVNAFGNVRVNFEVFCGDDGVSNCNLLGIVNANPLLLPSGRVALRGDDRDWYLNLDHNDVDPTNAANHADHYLNPYGRADLDLTAVGSTKVTNAVTISRASQNGINGIVVTQTKTGFERYGVNYSGQNDYPYTVLIQNTPSPWLVYNRPGDLNPNSNEYMLEFNKESGWIGESKSNQATDNDAAINSSRRIMW
ncbi:MAG: choice-of-anchor L domain-containing protein [Sulfuricurvum sp.]|uniref:choice-of-anchor L domain-containing protein n=1 Tax=Sulfuricurvum sp. TaxID=2025608 RepID=UPI002616ECEF|nr:choice-of-anchor L domain-containing protein [Sulfuricurvum sp.]MDD5158921.1 choice-of-anchor L domain-containing protein [Sulfuricurvum sp.]